MMISNQPRTNNTFSESQKSASPCRDICHNCTMQISLIYASCLVLFIHPCCDLVRMRLTIISSPGLRSQCSCSQYRLARTDPQSPSNFLAGTQISHQLPHLRLVPSSRPPLHPSDSRPEVRLAFRTLAS